MQKFLRTLMLAVLLLPFASQAQSTLTVADGTTTNSYVPVYGLYVDDFVRCQTVYPANMLTSMTGESILGLTYYLSTPAAASWGVANFVVNIMEVPDTTLSAFVDMTNATTVYTGSLDATQSTMVIEFTTPYMYQGGNLMVEIYNTLEGTYKSASFYGITKTGASWQGNNGTSVANITGATRAFMPKTTFAYGNPPTCFKVTGLAINASLTTNNSLTLTWNDLLNTNATYSVYAVTATDTTLVQSGITATTYTVTGLNANTMYSFAVMTDCGGGDVTGITAPVSGRTACDAIATLPYTMGFEADEIPATTPSADAFPFCWTRINDATSTSYNYYPYSYSSNARTGSRDLYFYGSTSSTYATNQLAVLPQLDVTLPVNTLQLSFWVRGSTSYGANLEVGTMSDPTDNTTFTTVQTIAVPVGSTYENHVVYFMNASSTDRYIAFRLVRGSSTQYAYVDDVVLDVAPSCFLVSNANVDSVSGTSAILSWNDNFNTGATYSIYNMADTSLIASGITPVPGANAITYTVTGLAGNTTYNLGIVANCSATDASEYAVVSFHTACVTIATLPYTMGFEADEIPATTPNAQAFPYCWTRINDATSSSYTYYPYSYSSNARTGSRDLYFYGSTSSTYATNQLAVLPQLDVTLPVNTLQLSFWVRGSTSYGANLEVGTMSDPTDMTTFTTVETIVVPASATYENHIVYFLNANATDSYIAFRLVKGTSTQYAYVDDVVLDVAPTCFPVSNLAVSSITDSSAVLSWTDNMNSGATYTLMSGNTVLYSNIPANADSIGLFGLSEATFYTLSLVANCSADDASEPVSVTFQTLASPVTSFPYTTGFESGDDVNWMLINDQTNAWHVGSAVNNGGSNALYISNDNGVNNAYTVSGIQFSYATRPIMLSDTNYYIFGFDWKAQGESSYDFLRAWLAPGSYIPTAGVTPGGTTSANGYTSTTPTGWIDLNPTGGKMNLKSEWQTIADTLLLQPGNYTVVLMWANDNSGGTQPPVAVDNFSIAPYVPVNLAITNLHGDAIAHNAFTAVWSGDARQTQWSVGIQAVGDTNAPVWQGANQRSVPFFGLTPNTSYNVYVTAIEPFLGYAGDTVMATVTTTELNALNCTVLAEGTTTNSYLPVYGLWADAVQRTQSVYPASMLTSMVGQTYTSMHYYVSTGSSASWGSNWVVRMGITTQEDVSAGWDATTLTTVYTGALTANTTDGMTITFDQPFTYNGGNLIIEFEQPTAGGYTSCSFYGASATGASRYGYSSSLSTGTVQNFLPQVQFCGPYQTTCYNVSNLVVENITTTTADVYWYPGNVETEWQMAVGTGEVNDSILLQQAVTVYNNVMTLTNLTPDADYWFYVRPVCDSVTYGNWTNATFTTLPTCSVIPASALALENLTSNSVTIVLNGELEHGTLHHFTINYWPEGGDTLTAVSNGSSLDLTGLEQNTRYYINITASCNAAGTDNSRTSNTYYFTTACGVEAMPFTENFSASLSSNLCWRGASVLAADVFAGTATLNLGSIPSNWSYQSGTSNGIEAGHYRINIYGTGRKDWMVTPAIDLSTATSAQLAFDAAFTAYSGTALANTSNIADDKFMVIISTDGGNTWDSVNAINFDLVSLNSLTYLPQVVNLNQYLGDTIKIAFYAESTVSGGDNNLHIDNIAVTEVPSCPNVVGLTLDGQTATSANISWTNNGADSYEVEVSQNGAAVTGVTVTINDTTAVITGLAIDNDYQVAVRSVCGTNYGTWSSALNIHIGYCLPTPTSVDGSGITSVSFGGMTNTTHPSSAAYANYSTMAGSVPAGTTATIDITYATGYTYGTIIWVDWNNSMTFDGNEVVYVGESSNSSPTTLTATFVVPATQDTGNYRMRILGADMAFDSYTGSIAAAAAANPCASYSYGVAEDYTLTVTEMPACLIPTGVTVTYNGGTTAIVSWNGNANAYNLSINGVVTYNVNNPDTITGLDLATTYTFMVQANCGTDTSDWSSAVSLTTDACTPDNQCAIYVYAQDTYGDGWTNSTLTFAQNGATVATYSMPSQNLSNVVIYDTFQLNVCNNAPVTLSWTSASSWDDEASFTIVNANGTVLNSVSDASDLTGGVFATLTSPCGIDTTGTDTTIVADTISITFAVNNATMGTTNPAPGTYQYAVGSVFTVTAVPNTGYHLADWSVTMNIPGYGPYTYQLGATDLTIGDTASLDYDSIVITALFAEDIICPDSVAIPFTENFDSTSTTRGCWTVANIDANSGLATGESYAYNGDGFFLFSYNTNPPQYLISPRLSGTGSTLQVEFYYKVMSATYPESFQVGYSTTTNDTSAFTWGTELTNLTNTTYTQYSEVLNAAGIKYVAIKYTANDQYYLFVDNFVARDVPTCDAITGLTVTGLTDSSATISWTGTTAGNYNVYNGTTLAANVNTTTYTFTGLTSSTTYTFGVEAVCSATETSDMVTVNVTTPCPAITTYPYVEDFSATPSCWMVLDADGDGYNWSLFQGTIQSASYASTALYPDNWLIAPQFAIPATGSYEVTWTATAQDQSWPAEHYGVFISTTSPTDTSAYTMIEQWTLSTGVFNPVIDLSAYAGQNIYIALRHFNCTDQFRLSIDNFTVRAQAGANEVVINVNQNNPAYGTVTGGGTYTIGDSVTVTATPATDYTFSRWIDENNVTVSTANPYTFVASTDLTLTAIFLQSGGTTYTITVQVNDSTMGTATGAGTYTAGDVVTLSATPYAGYEFVSWTQISGFGENLVSTDATFSTTATSDKTFRANFQVATVSNDSLTLIMAVNDATMGSVTPAPGTYHYGAGETINFSATPNAGYHVENVYMQATYMGMTFDSTIVLPVYTMPLPVDSTMLGMTISLTVNFAADQATTWTVSLSSADSTMGTVSPAGDTEVADGASFTATATANDGYYFSAWMSGNTVVSVDAVYTFTVTTNVALVAVFLPDSVAPVTRYHVTGEANDATMGYVTGSGYYEDGETVTLTAHAYSGYRFVRWSTGETTESIDITVDGEDVTVTAYFEVNTGGIEDADADDVTVYSTDSKIVVLGAEGSAIYVFDVNGRLVSNMANATETVEFRMANTGVYLVKVGAAPAKRVLVVR